jgi:hypothetical protein
MAAAVPIPGDALSGLKTIFDPATLTRKGLCPVTILKGAHSMTDSHSLYFEQHGDGSALYNMCIVFLSSH